jgi:membrane-associated phospholipid phosphatase
MLMPRAVLRRHRRVHWVLDQVLIVVIGVFCYFQVRGLAHADPSEAIRHAHSIMDLERRLGLRFELDVQERVIAHDSAYDVANWIYVWGHWPVIILTMLWLVLHHRDVFLRLRDGMLVSGALGLVVFVTYPVAPPRLVDPELIDTVTARSEAYRFLQPPNFVNQYAALPSLHAGWDLLVGIAIATAGGTLAVRLIGWVLPMLMGVAVVATANHYVVDVLAGIALALVGHAVALWLERRRARKSPPTPAPRRSAELSGVR